MMRFETKEVEIGGGKKNVKNYETWQLSGFGEKEKLE
jgi:hypothetical protein